MLWTQNEASVYRNKKILTYTEKRSWQTNINVLRDYSKNTLFSWRWDVTLWRPLRPEAYLPSKDGDGAGGMIVAE